MSTKKDYSLVGKDTAFAVEKGLAEADWYVSPVPREEMRKLLERRDGPALRDTALWLSSLLLAGACGAILWGSWWAAIPFAVYGVLYASASDSRWHESGHGTAFKTDWMNNALYELASFMDMRESVPWRWSHTRHHSDTIIVGRDPEIQVPRPPDLRALFMSFFSLNTTPKYFRNVVLHSLGRITAEEETYVPKSEFGKIFFRARIYLLIYACVIGVCCFTGSLLPLMFVGLPNCYGVWLLQIYGLTQHAGLAENVLDHRLNCRTVYMNPVHRFLYWNMNFHLEHHMFPLVPYHALPRLHTLVKDDCPRPYHSLLEAYREIIPAVRRQMKDPSYYVQRILPSSARPAAVPSGNAGKLASEGEVRDGWIEVCRHDDLRKGEVMRFDHGTATYALYRTEDGEFYATAGICTHGKTHLADGLLVGRQIECPKHNGRFDITDGSPRRRPACLALETYRVRIDRGTLFLETTSCNSTTL
jgi:MocE subfamily Rieske [2Fe-2S] domain protein